MGGFSSFCVLQISSTTICILLSLGCHNKIPQYEWFIESRNLLIDQAFVNTFLSRCLKSSCLSLRTQRANVWNVAPKHLNYYLKVCWGFLEIHIKTLGLGIEAINKTHYSCRFYFPLENECSLCLT